MTTSRFVNPRSQFVERVRLHQLAAGAGDAVLDYADMLGDGVRLVVDKAERIDAGARVVHLASGAVLDYDYLVYAVGSVGATPDAAPGAAKFAFAELKSARRLRTALAALRPGSLITVVGGGLTGVEIAAELADGGTRLPWCAAGLSRRTSANPVAGTSANGCAGTGRGRRRREHRRGASRRGPALRWRTARQRADDLDGRVRRAQAGRRERVKYR